MGNGIMTRYAYDPETFRLTRTRSEKYAHLGHTYTGGGGVQQDLAYTYDLEGSILTQNDEAPANASAQGPGGLLREFTHDPLRRLISATGRESSNVYAQPSWDLNIRPQDYTATNTYTRAYSYDKLGNIQTLNHVAAGHTNQNFNRIYNYGSPFTDNKLESFEVGSNTYDYQYDAAGNIVQEAANRYYEWTHNDKPATYSNQSGSSNPTVYTNYFYNAAGDRVKKHTRKGNRVEVTFYMDGGLFETSYVKPTGTSIDHNRFYNTLHVLDGSSRIATVRVGNDLDDPTPQVKYYLEDHLMDSLVVLNTSGSLINREEFYPFGETSFGGFAKKRYRFNGKEKDEESGLYYYGQRYYAPWLCRFISVDPIAESYPQLSSYNYAGNKPISSPDIDGLQGTKDPELKTNETQNLQEVVVEPEKTFWQKAGNFLYENVAKNIPVVGGIINAVESFSEGDIVGGFLGIGEALLDGVLLVTTGGLGNIAKAGLKSGGKILFKQLTKETGENILSNWVSQAVGDDVPLGLQIAAGLMGVRPKNWKKGVQAEMVEPSSVGAQAKKGAKIPKEEVGNKSTHNVGKSPSEIELPEVKKAVNSNLPHAVEQSVERGVFKNKDEATAGLKNLSDRISKDGFPEGSIPDRAHLDRVLVPIGNNGLAVYQIAKNRTAKLKTVLIAE